MIGYSQVSFRVRHSDGRTTFTIKTYISFEYLCPYSLVPIRRAYTLTNSYKLMSLEFGWNVFYTDGIPMDLKGKRWNMTKKRL